ncbi:MAG TPA: nucleotidyltransferase family protein [Chroococcales cyanobacterium]
MVPPFTRQIEDDLLLLTACESLSVGQKQSLERMLASGAVDWMRLKHLAQTHGTCGLLWRNLKPYMHCLPERFERQLRKAVDVNNKQSFLFAAELVKLKRLLELSGIPFLVYKGPSLALQAFGDLGAREYSDLDIIVDRNHVTAVQDLLLAAGYSSEPIDRVLNKSFMRSKAFRNLAFEQTFSRRTGVDAVATSFIDIHWEVGPPHVISLEFETLKQHSTELNILNHSFNCMKAEILVVLLACHAMKHQWLQLKWVSDIAALITRNPHLDWQQSYELARRFGVATKLDFALSLCAELPEFIEQLPPFVVERLKLSDDRLGWLKQMTLESWGRLQPIDSNLRRHWCYELNTFDSHVSTASATWHEFAKPDMPTYLRLPLPESLFPLYHFIRPYFTVKDFVAARMRAASSNRSTAHTAVAQL